MDIRDVKDFMIQLNEDASIKHQLDELSKETLLNYVKAANHAGHAYRAMQNQASNHVTYLNTGKRSKDKDFYRDQSIKDLVKYSRHAYNKQMGIDTAIKKIMAKENVEGLDELSRGLLARYTRKAALNKSNLSRKEGSLSTQLANARWLSNKYQKPDEEKINRGENELNKIYSKSFKREEGINRDLKRLAKEDVVQLGSSVKENFEFKDLISLNESYRSIFK